MKPHPHSRTANAHPHSSAGFTLVEVLVALTIGLSILLALSILLDRNMRNHRELESTSRQLENARFALDTLANDIRHAGYYGEFNSNDLGPVVTTPDDACTTDAAAFGWDTSGVTASIPAAIRGIPADTSIACLDFRLAGTEAVTVRHATTGDELPLTALPANNLYIQVSRCADDVLQVATATHSAGLTLRNIACTAPVNAVRRFMVRTYFIASCNDCVANDGIPTLKRVEMVDGELRTTALAEGIENLQIEYGVDTSAALDGRPDEFITAAQVNGVPASRAWENVIATRVHLLSRNTERTPGYTDPRTYRLGQVTFVPASSADVAAYKRTLMTETVRLFNMGDRYDQ